MLLLVLCLLLLLVLLRSLVLTSLLQAKQKWINTDPMTCEEDLLEQARLIKANNTLGASQRVWVYRNAVWAMPWMAHTR